MCFVLAKANNLDIEIIETVPPTKDLEYLKLHPLDKVPTFVGANDWILTEVMAVSIYCKSALSATNLSKKDERHYYISVIPV